MALSGWSDANYIEHGSAAALDDMTVGTVAYWLYTTSDTARQAIMSKFGTTTARGLSLSEQASPSTLDWQIGRLTTANAIVADLANFAYYAINKWLFVVCCFDSVTSGNNKMYIGDLTHVAAEPSAYTTQAAGSGGFLSDATGNWRVGRHATATGRQFVGSIATQYVADRVLTVGEIAQLQFSGRITSQLSIIASTHYGYNGATGSQIDWTGRGNHGTVTGTPTLAAHAPIGPMFGINRHSAYFVAGGGGPSFNAAWATAANTVIHSGAMAA